MRYEMGILKQATNDMHIYNLYIYDIVFFKSQIMVLDPRDHEELTEPEMFVV